MKLAVVLLDVIAWPFYVMSGLGILLAAALVVGVVLLTAWLIRRRKKK